jgi:hypothetical protein
MIQCEHRQGSRLNESEILLHGSLHGPVGLDPGGVQFVKRPGTDPTNHDGVNRPSSQGLQGLALTVLVCLIRIFKRLETLVGAVYKDEMGG